MKIATDDDRFGFVTTSLGYTGMFRFQMIVDGRLIGDTEPCMLGSAIYQLWNIRHLDDNRLGRLSKDPVAVFAVLRSDEVLHDAATLSLAESLDSWLVHGYVFEGNATILVQEYQNGKLSGPVLNSVLGEPEYYLILNAVRCYWQTAVDGGVTREMGPSNMCNDIRDHRA